MQGKLKLVLASCAVLLALLAAAVFLFPQRDVVDTSPESSSTGSTNPAPASMPRPRNVLLLVVDTLRSNRLSCYGYARPTTPNIDRLAQRGTLYRNNHSQSNWTLTSMISMMTGKSMIAEAKSLPSTVPCLASVVSEKGLETAAFVANPVVGKPSKFDRGFEVFELCDSVDALALAESFGKWYQARSRRATEGPKKRGFLAWVHFLDPHQPYEPASIHDVFEGPRPDEALLLPRWRAEQPRVAELAPDFAAPPFEQCVEEMTRDSNHYDGEVRAVDDGVGRILAELERGGELDDTLVILCADHGEMLYEHLQQPYIVRSFLDHFGGLPKGVMNLFGCGHRPWYYEDLWNTPLILAGPGMPVGVERSGMPANLDILPTCLDAFEIPSPPGLEGVSLLGGVEPSREEVYAYGLGTSVVLERSGKKLIVSPRLFYLLDEDQPQPVQMFDETNDPHEEKDIAPQQPSEVARMRHKIEDWRARSTRGWSGTYTPEQLKILHRLGYTGEDE